MNELRKAKLSDLAAINAIAESCPDLPRWSLAMLEAEITASKSYMAVWFQAGKVCGFGGFLRVLDEAQVTLIAVDAQERKRGLGKALMKHLIDTARGENLKKMTLEVSAANEAALNLYRHQGFEAVGRRPNFYHARGAQTDAILMDLIL